MVNLPFWGWSTTPSLVGGNRACLLEVNPIPCCNMMTYLGSIPWTYMVGGKKPTPLVAP